MTILKELTFLSLPDFFNKQLLTNFNQRFDGKNFLNLRFQLTKSKNLGFAVKSLITLELIFPKKAKVTLLKIKLKKTFSEKNNFVLLYYFDLNMTGYEFVEMYRFLGLKPLNVLSNDNLEKFPVITKRLKIFDLNNKLKVIPSGFNQSFFFLKLYHLD